VNEMTDVTALIDELYADEPATRINSALEKSLYVI
jgi:hypothetical protein